MKCMKKGMILGLTSAAFIGAGVLMYNFVLSPKTKKEMCRLEKDMCDDFENMISKNRKSFSFYFSSFNLNSNILP